MAVLWNLWWFFRKKYISPFTRIHVYDRIRFRKSSKQANFKLKNTSAVTPTKLGKIQVHQLTFAGLHCSAKSIKFKTCRYIVGQPTQNIGERFSKETTNQTDEFLDKKVFVLRSIYWSQTTDFGYKSSDWLSSKAEFCHQQ